MPKFECGCVGHISYGVCPEHGQPPVGTAPGEGVCYFCLHPGSEHASDGTCPDSSRKSDGGTTP